MIQVYRNMVSAAGSRTRHVKGGVVLGLISAIVQGAVMALLYPLFASLMGGGGDWRIWSGLIALFVVINAVLRWTESAFGYNTQMEVAHEVRIELGEKLRTMPMEYLHGRQSGDLNAVLSSNVHQVVTIMGGLYSVVIQTILAPIVTVLVTLFIDWRIALALAVVFPLVVPLYRKMREFAGREHGENTRALGALSASVVEYAQGLEVLRATRQVGEKSQKLQGAIRTLRERQTKGANWGILPNIAISSIVQVGMLLVASLGVFLVTGGSLELSVLFALIAISVRYAEPLSLFASLSTMFDYMESGLQRILDLKQIEPLPVNKPLRTPSTFDIEFADVHFAYSEESPDLPGEQVLNGVSFTCPETSLTALVGESGGGKTTITKLITRYADPQGGAVTIGGVDVRAMEPDELMRNISVVFQDVYLFDDTVRNNIRMAKPGASDLEIEQAAEAANCHEFVSRLPHGYDTMVGEIGGSLSGGERQRISIARAILKDAPIVLLDEPTSALDTESEVAVQRAIDALVASKTVLVIAHRLSTVVAADQILVVEDGSIVERGAHEDLLAANGRYAAMWAAQQQERRWAV